jgi:hypothetical protein
LHLPPGIGSDEARRALHGPHAWAPMWPLVGISQQTPGDGCGGLDESSSFEHVGMAPRSQFLPRAARRAATVSWPKSWMLAVSNRLGGQASSHQGIAPPQEPNSAMTARPRMSVNGPDLPSSCGRSVDSGSERRRDWRKRSASARRPRSR